MVSSLGWQLFDSKKPARMGLTFGAICRLCAIFMNCEGRSICLLPVLFFIERNSLQNITFKAIS
jgi:hypothetical protein